MAPLRTGRLSPATVLAWPFGVAVIAILTYLAFSAYLVGTGLPLDDAWIHQTYARNLVVHAEWAFQPGEPSSGSTAPLWTALLAVGHGLRASVVAWVAVLGAAFLAVAALAADGWVRAFADDQSKWRLGLALLMVTEWHLVWAALSGMETLALGVLALWVLYTSRLGKLPPIWQGALVGLGVWLRPDALSLALPVVWLYVFRGTGGRGLATNLASFSAGVALLFLPYLGFHYALSGAWWPSTFYAKQAEYAALRQAPLLLRFGSQLISPLVGVLAVLLPGLAFWLVRTLRLRRWANLAPLVWALAFLGSYALRLPVAYQHGRYAMPTIPLLLALGYEGMLEFRKMAVGARWHRIVRRAWLLSAAAVGMLFWPLGARAYAWDVAVIETEMVATAEWIDRRTPPDALIAAHDIGALGFFTDRRLVDLAGLVSPEVIPFLRDENALADYLDQQAADYLVTFPAWYPRLVRQARRVYTTEGRFSPALGGENMAVYQWEH